MKRYEAVYETIEDNEDNNEVKYIKLYNVGQKVTTRNCKGYVPSQIAFYLQNVHIGKRKVCMYVCETFDCLLALLCITITTNRHTRPTTILLEWKTYTIFVPYPQIWLTRPALSIGQVLLTAIILLLLFYFVMTCN